ncbi:hypothetical protein KA005_17635, partial [bacterium]|nr:hypothetical protein [bacterium]
LTPPATTLLIGEPHYVDEEASWWWITDSTPFVLRAIDNPYLYLHGNDTDPRVNYTMYNIDGLGWQLYTGPFNLSGLPPYPVQHWISYYSVDMANNVETPQYTYEIYIDYTPPELQNPHVTPSDGNETDQFMFNVTYVEDTSKGSFQFKNPNFGAQRIQDDMHVRKATGYGNNTHFVWMSDKTGKWEIAYKKIDPDGIAIRSGQIDVVQNQTIVNPTMISDSNNTDSMYPALVLEPHEEVYLNDPAYNNKYAILAAPVREYIDQEQLLENNNTLVNVTPNHWQEFVTGGRWEEEGKELWVDIMVYKDSELTYTNPLNLTVTHVGTGILVFSQSMPANQIIDGKQWLAFYLQTCKLLPNNRY